MSKTYCKHSKQNYGYSGSQKNNHASPVSRAYQVFIVIMLLVLLLINSRFQFHNILKYFSKPRGLMRFSLESASSKSSKLTHAFLSSKLIWSISRLEIKRTCVLRVRKSSEGQINLISLGRVWSLIRKFIGRSSEEIDPE